MPELVDGDDGDGSDGEDSEDGDAVGRESDAASGVVNEGGESESR